jgi:alpha-tubulin suppressor-like RCC1 family protein
MLARSSSNETTLQDLPLLELFTAVCQQLDLRGLVRVAETCKRFRYGDSGLETAELPTKSPVVMALVQHAFPGGELVPSTLPTDCSESWVSYLARCVRQRRCREAPPIAAGDHSLFMSATGQVLTCGECGKVAHGDADRYYDPTPVAAMAGVRVRSVAAGKDHSLALSWDGRVYSWGKNGSGQLGQGDRLDRPSPTLVEGLEGVRGIAANSGHSLAVTQSGEVSSWDKSFQTGAQDALWTMIVEGFGGVRVRRVCAGSITAFAIGEAGELFSWGLNTFRIPELIPWGQDEDGLLGHGDKRDQPSPKRVEVLRGVRVSSVSVGMGHALALTEDGQVYAWGNNHDGATLGNVNVDRQLLPKPIEALQGVRVGSIVAVGVRSYAVADTGELLAWGYDCDCDGVPSLGHDDESSCPLPMPLESLCGINMDSVAGSNGHTLALADDGRVLAWGSKYAAESGALGLGRSVSDARDPVPTPWRIPAPTCGVWTETAG